MRRLLLASLLAGCSGPPPAEEIGTLARRLRDSLPAGEWGYYVRDLKDGETLEMRAEEPFPPDGKSPREVAKLAPSVALPNGRSYVAVFLSRTGEGSADAAARIAGEYMSSKK